MIIPSIDIQGGQTVQLIGGKDLELQAGEPLPLLKKFGRVGEVAVIDLDAAMSVGNNQDLIRSLLGKGNCRVGGGIRDVETAISWLDAGAAKIILGTAATPEILKPLPRDRVIAALDAIHSDSGSGKVVDQGWTNDTGQSVVERIQQLKSLVGGFLITFVEREGRMTGIDIETISRYKDAVGDVKLTVAGGVATAEEIGMLDQLGVDAQIGMALYKGDVSLASGFCSPMNSDRPDGLWPTVVADEAGLALGLAYSNLESVNATLESGVVHYWSRKRGLWKKGESSGNTQKIVSVSLDCDRDSLLFKVQQHGQGFCHLDQPSCFGQFNGLAKLESLLRTRLNDAPDGSYSRRLFDSPELLNAKIIEEANEFVSANNTSEIIHESADVIFFTLTKIVKAGISLREIEAELDRRSLKVTRRKGNAKVELSS